MTPSDAVSEKQQDVARSGAPFRRRISAYGYVRCECRRCGSHLNALAMGELLMGVCGNCGSTESTPVTE